jgi:DNA-damage-inducible protein J
MIGVLLMAQANLTIRIDESLKKEAEILFDKIGLTMTSAIIVYFRQAILEQAIPFRIRARTGEDEAIQFRQLIDSIRAENEVKGFLTDDEVNEEIRAYRNERRANAV